LISTPGSFNGLVTVGGRAVSARDRFGAG
jgi:hypothetical protein